MATWNLLSADDTVKARAVLGLGTSAVAASHFGIGHARTAAQNATGFADAIEWASDDPYSRTLVIPPMNSDEYIALEEHVRLPAGFRMQGSGKDSRFFMATKPEPAFLCTGRVELSGLYFEGLEDRLIVNGTFGRRENYDAMSYSGVLLLSGSDGSVIRNMYGLNVNSTVAAWGWDEDAEEYGGNIQGLDIFGVYSENVWVGMFWREVDYMTVSNVYTKAYSSPGDYEDSALGAPPHGLYCTSTGGIAPEERWMHCNRVSNVRVEGGRFGSAVSIKYQKGSHISDIQARDCEGLIDINSLIDSTISNVRGIDDVAVVAATDPHVGSVNVRKCIRTLISDVKVTQSVTAEARLLYMDDDNDVTVEVRDFYGVANYAGANVNATVQELALVRGGTLTRPTVSNAGASAISRGIRRADTSGDVGVCGDTIITDPTVSGVALPLVDDGIDDGTSFWSFEARKNISTNTSGRPALYAVAGTDRFKDQGGVGPAPDPVWVAWSTPEHDLTLDESGALTHFASGHTVTRVGTVNVNDTASAPLTRWVRTTTTSGDSAAYIDTGFNEVDASIRCRTNASGTIIGILLHYVDANNFLTAELRTTGAYIRSVVGGTPTDVDSDLFTRLEGDIYDLRATKRGSNVTVYVNGEEAIAATSVGSPAQTAYGSSTNQGYYWRDSTSGYSSNFRLKPLS